MGECVVVDCDEAFDVLVEIAASNGNEVCPLIHSKVPGIGVSDEMKSRLEMHTRRSRFSGHGCRSTCTLRSKLSGSNEFAHGY
jgi:hypothetical protein